jgi:hypothetical protein
MRSAARGLAALLLALSGAAGAALAQVPGCAKADFEAVVNEAGAALRDLNRENTPRFQGKLRELKDKRGWGNDQFLKEAEPFVRDGEIVAYDQKSEELLVRITGGGQQASSASAPDCAALTGLREAMKLLLETQKAKWAHMFAKLDKELTK